ncbi:pfp [Symbiodinium microadriaticum]|nr:pfp [Symbiodinium microadriaticum]
MHSAFCNSPGGTGGGHHVVPHGDGFWGCGVGVNFKRTADALQALKRVLLWIVSVHFVDEFIGADLDELPGGAFEAWWDFWTCWPADEAIESSEGLHIRAGDPGAGAGDGHIGPSDAAEDPAFNGVPAAFWSTAALSDWLPDFRRVPSKANVSDAVSRGDLEMAVDNLDFAVIRRDVHERRGSLLPPGGRRAGMRKAFWAPYRPAPAKATDPVPGYHPVIAGLFDYLDGLPGPAKLIGFFCGYEGLLKDLWAPITKDMVDQFRNLGGQVVGSWAADPFALLACPCFRGLTVDRSRDWQCPNNSCRERNFVKRPACFKCGTPRPAEDARRASQPPPTTGTTLHGMVKSYNKKGFGFIMCTGNSDIQDLYFTRENVSSRLLHPDMPGERVTFEIGYEGRRMVARNVRPFGEDKHTQAAMMANSHRARYERGYDEEDTSRDWNCPSCNERNFLKRNVCFKCQTPKPIVEDPAGGPAAAAAAVPPRRTLSPHAGARAIREALAGGRGAPAEKEGGSDESSSPSSAKKKNDKKQKKRKKSSSESSSSSRAKKKAKRSHKKHKHKSQFRTREITAWIASGIFTTLAPRNEPGVIVQALKEQRFVSKAPGQENCSFWASRPPDILCLQELGDVRNLGEGCSKVDTEIVAGREYQLFIANPSLSHRCTAILVALDLEFVHKHVHVHEFGIILHGTMHDTPWLLMSLHFPHQQRRDAPETWERGISHLMFHLTGVAWDMNVILGHDLNQDLHAVHDEFVGMLHYREMLFQTGLQTSPPLGSTWVARGSESPIDFIAYQIRGAEVSFTKREDLRVALPSDHNAVCMKVVPDKLLQELQGAQTEGSYIQRCGGLERATTQLFQFYDDKYSTHEAPVSEHHWDSLAERHSGASVAPVTKEEVLKALKGARNGVSAGMDGVTYEGVTHLLNQDQQSRIPAFFTALIRGETPLPPSWKQGKIVLLPKVPRQPHPIQATKLDADQVYKLQMGLWHVVPMHRGLMQGTAYSADVFSRVIDHFLGPLHERFCEQFSSDQMKLAAIPHFIIYADDIILFADSPASLQSKLQHVIDVLATLGLQVNPDELCDVETSLVFLGVPLSHSPSPQLTISHLLRKTNHAYYGFKRIMDCGQAPLSVRLLIFETFITAKWAWAAPLLMPNQVALRRIEAAKNTFLLSLFRLPTDALMPWVDNVISRRRAVKLICKQVGGPDWRKTWLLRQWSYLGHLARTQHVQPMMRILRAVGAAHAGPEVRPSWTTDLLIRRVQRIYQTWDWAHHIPAWETFAQDRTQWSNYARAWVKHWVPDDAVPTFDYLLQKQVVIVKHKKSIIDCFLRPSKDFTEVPYSTPLHIIKPAKLSMPFIWGKADHGRCAVLVAHGTDVKRGILVHSLAPEPTVVSMSVTLLRLAFKVRGILLHQGKAHAVFLPPQFLHRSVFHRQVALTLLADMTEALNLLDRQGIENLYLQPLLKPHSPWMRLYEGIDLPPQHTKYLVRSQDFSEAYFCDDARQLADALWNLVRL